MVNKLEFPDVQLEEKPKDKVDKNIIICQHAIRRVYFLFGRKGLY